MSKFKPAVMTDAGAELLAKSIAEGFRLEFVRMVTGSGIYEEGEKTTAELRRRTELKVKRQEIGFSSITAAEENAVKLKALITNEKLETGYRLTEIGIIAKKEDSEILYSIAIAEEADYLPSKENPIEITQEYYTRVSNAENVCISVKMGAVALAEDLDATYQKAAGYTDQKIADLIGGAPETLDTLKEVADAIEENEDVVSALNAAIGNKANQAELDAHARNGTIHITATERENWGLCGAEMDYLSKKTNIEYFYPDIENGLMNGNSGAESLTAAIKDATQKLSESVLGITPEHIGALSTPTSLKGSLDDYKNPGFYYAVGGNKITEKPQGVDAFGLLVTREGNINRGQLLMSSQRNIGIYARIWTEGLGSWYDWVQIFVSDWNVTSATNATYDENGYRITGYLKHDGDASDITVNFTSADSEEPSEWTDVALLKNTNKFWGIFNRISIMFRNVRYLYKMLGTTDISHVGNGTVTGALNELNARTNYPLVRISASITDYVDSINEGFGFFIINTNAQTAGVPNANYTYTTGYYAKINNGTSKIVIFSRGTNDSIVKTKYTASEWSDWFSFA